MTALLFLRLRREAILLALTVAGAWLVESGIKALVGRARPEIVPHLTEAGGASFPSGHSFNSAVVYIAIALAFATLSARQSVRFTVIGIAIVLSLLIAWSRVWLGVHFPSDVIAGWLGGAGWAFLSAALLFRPAQKVAQSEQAKKLDPSGGLTARRAGRHRRGGAQPPRPRPLAEARVLVLHRDRAFLALDPGHRQDRPAAKARQRGRFEQDLAGESGRSCRRGRVPTGNWD